MTNDSLSQLTLIAPTYLEDMLCLKPCCFLPGRGWEKLAMRSQSLTR
ncbi:hypothetical protein LC605_31285 [Nostoc sp. CHAB 5836]|nr:hypothetical protein [Nostoc sp. CHAB 5836]